MDEADQEVMMMDHVQLVVNKGKRTKRQRPCSPITPSLMNTSSSSSDHEGSLEFTDSTEEEEDMANCLILLAQGQGLADHHHHRHHPKRIIQDSGGGGYVYKCKTCNRCFPSFQALGGHRASHKKPKNSVVEEKVKSLMLLEDDQIDHNSTTPSLSLHLGNRTTSPSNVNKSKVHECSICGSEFSSGQALGGHMRRHRPSMATTTSDHHQSHHQEVFKKERNNVLSLDLNLPAPEDDRETKFAFSAKHESPLVFCASALVDCHY